MTWTLVIWAYLAIGADPVVYVHRNFTDEAVCQVALNTRIDQLRGMQVVIGRCFQEGERV